MFLTIAAGVCAWLSGVCQGLSVNTDGESKLVCQWCARFLLLSAVIFLVLDFTVGHR